MGLCGPDQPDPVKGFVSGSRAELEAMQFRRAMEAAALGGGKFFGTPPGANNPQEYDFTGLGEADYAKAYGDASLQQLLAIQREFGPQYVEQRLAELEAADPEGAAMRRRLWNTIKTGVESGPTDRPDLQALQDAVMQELDAGGKLDPKSASQISQRVLGGQVARGNFLGNAAAADEAGALVAAGEAQRQNRQAQAMAFLTGQLSPEEAAMRESQQNMANLGAFTAGETPQAQFRQLSGAGAGAAPYAGQAPTVGIDPNAGWAGVNNYMGLYGLKANEVNPWVAGLGGAFQGAGVWAKLGGNFGGVANSPGVQGGWNGNFGTANAGQV